MDRKVPPPQYQVFINFRGEELRNKFISHLVDALKRNEINIFIDKKEQKGEDISNLFKRIEESKIVLAVFSERYTESRWCLDELVKIKECADQGKLRVIPIPSVESTNSPVNKVPERGEPSKTTKKSQKTHKGNLLSPPEGVIVPPQDIASGQGRTRVTIKVSQASSPANESRLGVPPAKGPYKTAVQPSHGSAYTGVYDGFPISYKDHIARIRGEGESSSMPNNSKKKTQALKEKSRV